MQHHPPRLALPINCVVDSEGRLQAADAPVRRLHSGNGGIEGGVLAVPGLLDLASLCWRIGLRLERTVYVADKDHDLELWVEAEKKDKAIHLSIVGWQERASAPRAPFLMPGLPHRPEKRISFPAMLVSADGIILHASAPLIETFGPDWLVGDFDEYFDVVGHEGGFAGLLRAQTADPGRIEIEHRASGSLRPVLVNVAQSDAGTIVGARLVFMAEDRMGGGKAVANSGSGAPHSGIGLGRHFATAVRQPLGRILANAETIGAELNGPISAQYSSYARDIASAARHLSELVGDLEDLDAIDKPGFKVAHEPVELGDIARRVIGLLALKAADHQIELVAPSADLHGNIVGEFRRVLQIVLNLVGNAIRYAPDGSRITISIDPLDPSISVEDEGAGIAEEDRERVFCKFERLGRTGDGGSGLGLYISRKLARAMGGDLAIGSAQSGGARFTLRLPAA